MQELLGVREIRIRSLSQILEAKMKLDNEQLQKEILQIKQMIDTIFTGLN